MAVRSPDEVLARARALSLLSIVEDGMYTDMIPSFVEELALEPWLTDQERAWLAGDADLSAVDGYRTEAMLVMAWALGLMPTLGDRHPDAYGPILCLLQNLETTKPEDIVSPRADADLRTMLAELDAIAARGDAPPPNERFGEPCLRFRRAALRWLLDANADWSVEAERA
jgi:Domain of unknown function (DUF4272)